MIDWLKYVFISLGIAGAFLFGRSCGHSSRDAEVADLALRLAHSQQTIELKDGLFAVQTVEINELGKLLDTQRQEVKNLQRQLADSRAKLLTTQELVIKWKKAYEGAVKANQTEEPSPTDPTVIRKRVDFEGELGPVNVTGHTITDPPEAFVSLRQTRPLLVTVSVAQNTDGTWTSYATSSEPNMEVGIRLAGVNPHVLDPKWYQRLWLEAGGTFLGDRSAYLGVSYHFDRVSVGPQCAVWDGSVGCGLTIGYRLFK